MLRVIDPKKPCTDLPAELATTYTWSLDPFQQHAIAAIHRNENVLVTAKTGSGKTLVGEYQIHHSLARGKRVFYTTPIKSLSNQKFSDLKKMFPSVGILTGDIKFKPDAQVVVMTTEILRNMLYKRGTGTASLGLSAAISLDDLDAVVFDEVHYINNPERGKVWEETLILLPPEIRLILLSATLAAPEAFAQWIGDLKQKPCVLISTLHRVVPLSHYVIQGDDLKCIMGPDEHYEDGLYKGWLRWREGQADGADKYRQKVKDARAGGTEGAIGGKVAVHSFVHTMNTTINLLADKGLLPALMFVFSRKDCERFAGKVEGSLIDSNDVASVRHIVDFHLHRYKAVCETSQYHELYDLLQRGIGYHHSGLLPLLKEIVEMLFAKGLIKVLFCTETFAVGINMPTKTAIFLDYHKYDARGGGGQRCLYTDEYLQMAGRAGRRGLDKVGTVIYLPQRRPAYADEVKTMMSGSTRAITSRMDFHYDFLLKVMQSGSLNCLSVMRNSYWYKQRLAVKALLEKEIEGLKEDYAKTRGGLTDAEFMDLSERAKLEETLRNSVNAAKKEAQRALGAWQNRHFGPKWEIGWKALPALKRLETAIAQKIKDAAACDELISFVEPRLVFLAKAGFITEGPVDLLGPANLTLKGILATEVNESHSLLTAEVYQSGLMAEASGETILTVLAAFITEKLDAENAVGLHELRVPDAVVGFLRKIDDVAAGFASVEGSCGLPSDDHWALGTQWIEPVWRWLDGEPAQVLCSEYGMYAGNLLRTVLRIANVADEWISLATYCEHTAMVERMTTVKERILRDIAVTDSLYLRL
jgi:superfamily II RNA helicase